jgi:hypothetical protein
MQAQLAPNESETPPQTAKAVAKMLCTPERLLDSCIDRGFLITNELRGSQGFKHPIDAIEIPKPPT